MPLTSKDAVTIVTRGEPQKNADALLPHSGTATLNLGLMDTDYNQGVWALMTTTLRKWPGVAHQKKKKKKNGRKSHDQEGNINR